MRISVILGHPDQGSFNHAIADVAIRTLWDNEHDVAFHDLYKEGFDPILPPVEIPKGAPLDPLIEGYCDEVSNTEGIIIVHPNWWGQPPAVVKGWVDRVIRPGVAYEFVEGDSGEGVPVGLLKTRTALVFNTSNTQRQRELEVFGDPLETLWKNCIFGLCGIENFYRKMYGVIVTSTPEQRRIWLADVRETVDRYFPRLAK
ncbi:MAG TPA: NAD(P)H-dependent oxidoreductase [Anaerolineae bacterium]|nr:NAD(P)H-dependent oxidoreductase [Anaerolineae bacterium]